MTSNETEATIVYVLLLLLFRPFFTGRGGISSNIEVKQQFHSYPVSLSQTVFISLVMYIKFLFS